MHQLMEQMMVVCNDSVNYTWDSNTCIANVTCSIAHTAYDPNSGDCEPVAGYKWADSIHSACDPIVYSVAFYANGGSRTMANQSMTYDTSDNLTTNGFTVGLGMILMVGALEQHHVQLQIIQMANRFLI